MRILRWIVLAGFWITLPASARQEAPRPIHFARQPSLSPDGQRLATGSWDGVANVWEAASGRELFALKGHTDRISSVAWAADGPRALEKCRGSFRSIVIECLLGALMTCGTPGQKLARMACASPSFSGSVCLHEV